MAEYTPKKVAEYVGVTPRKLQHWIDSSLTSIDNTKTQMGVRRSFSKKNILEFKVIKELSDLGVRLSTMKWAFGEASNIPSLKIAFDKALDPSTYDRKNPTGVFITLYKRPDEDGGINPVSVSFKRNPKTMKAATKIEIDFSKYPSAVVINVNRLFESIKDIE